MAARKRRTTTDTGGARSRPRSSEPRLHIGISGFDYPRWRGAFYPAALAKRRWLWYASRTFPSIELNGTFYSLKTPAVFARWVREVPDDGGFVFSIKGSRFITHNLKLRRAEQALGNFFASGLLALGEVTGPLLWQLPATYAFDAERIDEFLRLLPRTSAEAEAVARRHDQRLRDAPLVRASADLRWRHALEVRHESYLRDEFFALLRRHDCAFVIADTAGKFAYAEEVTADFVYVRLHGSRQLYVSGYADDELDAWATKVRAWRDGGRSRRDVFVYFDNDARVHAPFDALRLMARLGLAPRDDRDMPAS